MRCSTPIYRYEDKFLDYRVPHECGIHLRHQVMFFCHAAEHRPAHAGAWHFSYNHSSVLALAGTVRISYLHDGRIRRPFGSATTLSCVFIFVTNVEVFYDIKLWFLPCRGTSPGLRWGMAFLVHSFVCLGPRRDRANFISSRWPDKPDQENILIRHDLKLFNPSSRHTPGQSDFYIFAMASDLSVDPPEDLDQRPSTILFEIIAPAITDIIFRFQAGT